MVFAANSGNEVKESAELPFYLGIEAKMMRGQDIKDVKSATDIWLILTGEKYGIQAKTSIYDDLDSMANDFIQGQLDMVSMTTLDYLKFIHLIGEELELGPTGVYDGKALVKYLLLARKDLKFVSISDLRGKKLTLQSIGDIERLFINTLLLRADLKELNDFFGDIIEKIKPSRAILDVFFRQSDVCVVPEYVFTTMIELNPQLGRQMKVLAASPEVIPVITGFHKNCDPRVRKILREVISSLKDSEKGEQILLMYKSEGLTEVRDTDLDTLRSMVLVYESLKAKYKTNDN